MKKKNSPGALIISAAASALLLMPACSKNTERPQPERQQTDTSWHKHVPPASDMLIVVNMSDLRRSEWYKASSTEPQDELLQARAGFSYDDIEVFAVASDLDSFPPLDSLKGSLRLDADGQPDPNALTAASLDGINATVLLSLHKTISWQQAEAAVEVFFSSVSNSTIESASGAEALIVMQESSPMPLRIRLSPDRKTLIMNSGSLPERDKTSAIAPEVLARLLSIETSSPIVMSLSPSSEMQRKLSLASAQTNQAAQADASTVILNTAMQAMSSFKGFSMALDPSETSTAVYAEMEMGSESDALEAEAAIKNILIPLVTLTLTQYSPDSAQEPILQTTRTVVRKNKVILRSKLNTQIAAPTQESSSGEL